MRQNPKVVSHGNSTLLFTAINHRLHNTITNKLISNTFHENIIGCPKL